MDASSVGISEPEPVFRRGRRNLGDYADDDYYDDYQPRQRRPRDDYYDDYGYSPRSTRRRDDRDDYGYRDGYGFEDEDDRY